MNFNYLMRLFESNEISSCKKRHELFNKYANGEFRSNKKIEEIYGIDVNELVLTQNGRNLGLNSRNRLIFICTLAEMQAYAELDDRNTNIIRPENYYYAKIEDILDCTSKEALDRKKKAGGIIKELIMSGNKKDISDFIVTNNKAFRAALDNYIDEAVDILHSSNDSMTEKFLQIDDLLNGHHDGMSEVGFFDVPKEDIEDNANSIYMADMYNDIYRQARSRMQTLSNKTVIDIMHCYVAITDKLMQRCAIISTKSGDYKSISAEVCKNIKPTAFDIVDDYKPNNGKGIWNLLSQEDIIRLASIDSLYDKVGMVLESDEDGNSRIKSLTIDGIELYGDETEKTVKQEDLLRVKNAISECYYEEHSFESIEDIAMLDEDAGNLETFEQGFMADMRVNMPNILAQNTTRFNSSQNYRDMQEEFERFSRLYEDIDDYSYERFEYEPLHKVEIIADLERVTNVVKKYLDGKDAFNPNNNFKNDYERKRVNGAREIYRRLIQQRKQIDAYDRCKKYMIDKSDIEDKDFYNEFAKPYASKLCDIGHSRKDLTARQKEEVKDCLENLCLDRFKLVIEKLGDPAGRVKVSDEQLRKEIRKSDMYKYYTRDIMLNADAAKTILYERLECKVVKSIVDAYEKKNVVDKEEKEKQRENINTSNKEIPKNVIGIEPMIK